MRIGTREVGPGHPTFIVAEGGSNHGGSLDAALALTDAAADAGADAMKWQLWNPDKMYDPNQFPEEYASSLKWALPTEWLPSLQKKAHERGLAFGCSAFDFDSLDYVDQFVDFHKVASIESEWWDFVRAVLAKKKPTFESRAFGNTSWKFNSLGIIPLLCAVAYPLPLNEANLRAHPQEEPGVDGAWGLSDHTTHPTIAPCAAVALGACVIEKHIRPIGWKNAQPPDYAHSISPSEFNQMVAAIRLTELALGSSEKRIRPSEEKYLKYRRGPRGLRGA